MADPELPAAAAQEVDGVPAPLALTDSQATSPAPPLSAAGLKRLCEGLLFVAPSPTPVDRFAQALGATAEAVEAAMTALQADYLEQDRGLRLLHKGDRYHLTSVPEAAPYIERFLGLDLSTKLSQAALETLAIIAYRQPVTRADIEAVRGVSCDAVLRTLLVRELVEPVGRLEQAGRPFLYGTTVGFLQYFGLDSVDRLPGLPESSG